MNKLEEIEIKKIKHFNLVWCQSDTLVSRGSNPLTSIYII